MKSNFSFILAGIGLFCGSMLYYTLYGNWIAFIFGGFGLLILACEILLREKEEEVGTDNPTN